MPRRTDTSRRATKSSLARRPPSAYNIEADRGTDPRRREAASEART